MQRLYFIHPVKICQYQMPRPDRLFRLLTALRTLPQPVTAARLAAETEVSPRTLYRDIETLRMGGALIDGAAGLGYTLTEDPALPPQMFTRLEVEALVLGLAEVALAGDPALAKATVSAQAKITATLPERVQRQAVHAVQQTYRFEKRPAAAHLADRRNRPKGRYRPCPRRMSRVGVGLETPPKAAPRSRQAVSRSMTRMIAGALLAFLSPATIPVTQEYACPALEVNILPS